MTSDLTVSWQCHWGSVLHICLCCMFFYGLQKHSAFWWAFACDAQHFQDIQTCSSKKSGSSSRNVAHNTSLWLYHWLRWRKALSRSWSSCDTKRCSLRGRVGSEVDSSISGVLLFFGLMWLDGGVQRNCLREVYWTAIVKILLLCWLSWDISIQRIRV